MSLLCPRIASMGLLHFHSIYSPLSRLPSLQPRTSAALGSPHHVDAVTPPQPPQVIRQDTAIGGFSAYHPFHQRVHPPPPARPQPRRVHRLISTTLQHPSHIRKPIYIILATQTADFSADIYFHLFHNDKTKGATDSLSCSLRWVNNFVMSYTNARRLPRAWPMAVRVSSPTL